MHVEDHPLEYGGFEGVILSKVFDNARPECQQFTRYWTVVTCGRVNHHELRFRFHENELHPQTPQHELTLLAGQNPSLVAVAEG